MRKLLTSLLIVSLMSGCASYVSTNCIAGPYAHCDNSRAIVPGSNNGSHYLIKDNLLFLAKDGTLSATPAGKEEVLDFGIQHPEYVAMYDPIAGVATIHRRVVDYQENQGQALLGLALMVVGTAAVVALAKSHETCFNRHLSRYRGAVTQTNKAIFNSDEKGVGSKRWQHDIDVNHENAMRELTQAYACLY